MIRKNWKKNKIRINEIVRRFSDSVPLTPYPRVIIKKIIVVRCTGQLPAPDCLIISLGSFLFLILFFHETASWRNCSWYKLQENNQNRRALEDLFRIFLWIPSINLFLFQFIFPARSRALENFSLLFSNFFFFSIHFFAHEREEAIRGARRYATRKLCGC